MKQINKPTENLGGLLKIWAVPKSGYSINKNIVTFSDPGGIYEIYCSPGSISYTEEKERTVAGMHYNCTVSGFVPRDTETVKSAAEDMEHGRYVIIYLDGNGLFKLVGTAAEPLEFSGLLDTGKDTAGRAGYEIEFTGKTTARAVFIENPF